MAYYTVAHILQNGDIYGKNGEVTIANLDSTSDPLLTGWETHTFWCG